MSIVMMIWGLRNANKEEEDTERDQFTRPNAWMSRQDQLCLQKRLTLDKKSPEEKYSPATWWREHRSVLRNPLSRTLNLPEGGNVEGNKNGIYPLNREDKLDFIITKLDLLFDIFENKSELIVDLLKSSLNSKNNEENYEIHPPSINQDDKQSVVTTQKKKYSNLFYFVRNTIGCCKWCYNSLKSFINAIKRCINGSIRCINFCKKKKINYIKTKKTTKIKELKSNDDDEVSCKDFLMQHTKSCFKLCCPTNSSPNIKELKQQKNKNPKCECKCHKRKRRGLFCCFSYPKSCSESEENCYEEELYNPNLQDISDHENALDVMSSFTDLENFTRSVFDLQERLKNEMLETSSNKSTATAATSEINNEISSLINSFDEIRQRIVHLQLQLAKHRRNHTDS